MSPVPIIRGSTLCHSTFNGLYNFDRIFFERILRALFRKKKNYQHMFHTIPKSIRLYHVEWKEIRLKKGSSFF